MRFGIGNDILKKLTKQEQEKIVQFITYLDKREYSASVIQGFIEVLFKMYTLNQDKYIILTAIPIIKDYDNELIKNEESFGYWWSDIKGNLCSIFNYDRFTESKLNQTIIYDSNII